MTPRLFAFIPWGTLSLVLLFSNGCTTLSPSGAGAHVTRQTLPTTLRVSRLQDRSGHTGRTGLDGELTALLVESLIQEKGLEISTPPNDMGLVERLRRTKNDYWPPKKALKSLDATPEPASFRVDGSITEFTADGPRGRAEVTLRLSIRDLSSGRTLASINASGQARKPRSRDTSSRSAPAFGSEAFFRSPLGLAAQEAIRQATLDITQKTPKTYWDPLVAGVADGRIILNGGLDRGFQTGQVYDGRGAGEAVPDPITGRVLTTVAGRVIGRIQVSRVENHVAFAEPLRGGSFKRMQRLVPAHSRN